MVLGNSNGNNTGKKYKKLTGNEIASPEDKARADKFAKWYGLTMETLVRELINKEMYDYDIMTDTFLAMYDAIALKNLQIDSYKSYFYRAYYTNTINIKAKEQKIQQMLVHIDDPYNNWCNISETEQGEENINIQEQNPLVQSLITTDFDHNLYEAILEQLHAEVLEYIRANYNEMNASIYEMYVNLNISCTELSRRLNYPTKKVFNRLYEMKKDIVRNFEKRKNELLGMV